MKITKVRKTFMYEGIEMRIVEREEPYMNAKMTMLRVLAPNGGSIPIQIRHKETLKSIMERTIEAIEGFKRRGADVLHELTKEIPGKESN